MEEVKSSVLDALEKMHKLLNNKKGLKQEDIKTDISIANATSNLAKVDIATIVLEHRLENAKNQNTKLLGDL